LLLIKGSDTIFSQYSFNQAVITPGLMLTIDTVANTITSGSFDPTSANACK
jgi:hypothetical protein